MEDLDLPAEDEVDGPEPAVARTGGSRRMLSVEDFLKGVAPVQSAQGDRRCGVVAIIGQPNVGKSTLMNALVGQKVSITSKKAQTTRHRITGVATEGDAQFIFVDTPGFQTRHATALNRNLNRTVLSSLNDVDVVVFVVEAGRFTPADAKVLDLCPPGKPVILLANKIDKLQRRSDLAAWLQEMAQRHPFTEFVPLSAYKKDDVRRVFDILRPYLPEQDWWYDEEMLTDKSERFQTTEIIREKLFRLTGDEVPYSSTVIIDRWEQEGQLTRIAATIVVEREAHKGMIIGAKGERLKRIGSEARQDLEQLLDGRVFLELWVKVRQGWADSEEHLRSYGYE